jgi:hypothetical protein
MRLSLVFAGVICAGIAGIAGAASEVYKWVDKNGVTHYGDRPKQGGEALEVKPASGEGPAPATLQSQAARDAECNRQKAALENYRGAAVIKETNSLGEQRELSADERQKFIALTEKKVETACAAPPAAAK